MHSRVGLLLVLLGAALVGNPLYLFERAGETKYVYEAGEIEYTEGTTGHIRAPTTIVGLDCYRERDHGCLLAELAAQQGPIRVNVSLVHRYPSAEYVAVYTAPNGEPFYRRHLNVTTERHHRWDTATYRLEPVSTETVLRNVARDVDEVPEPVQQMVATGNVTLYDRTLTEGTVVRDDDGTYYVVDQTVNQSPDLSADDARFLHAAVAVVGVLVALRGQRLRVG